MYAVIFKATVKNLDKDYLRTTKRLKELAFKKYGCLDFVSVTEGDQEIAISYWQSESQILAWKKDPEHNLAQHKGRNRWYSSYRVEVCELTRSYEEADSLA